MRANKYEQQLEHVRAARYNVTSNSMRRSIRCDRPVPFSRFPGFPNTVSRTREIKRIESPAFRRDLSETFVAKCAGNRGRFSRDERDRRDRTRARRRVNGVNASCLRSLRFHYHEVERGWIESVYFATTSAMYVYSTRFAARYSLPAIYQLGKQTRWSPVCLSCINSSSRHFVTRE